MPEVDGDRIRLAAAYIASVGRLAATLAAQGQPGRAQFFLQRVGEHLKAHRDRDLIDESTRTGRAFGFSGDAPPTRATVTSGKPIQRRPFDRALHRRVAQTHRQRQPRQREHRPRKARRAAASSAASRDGPGLGDEPPDEPDHVARPQLTRAGRDYLKTEVDRLRREQLAAQRALDRALFAWGAAEVVA